MRTSELNLKFKIFAGIVIGLLLVLCLKLAVVQLFYSEQYQSQAQDNSLRLVSIKAPRGEIYDRNGTVLAANKSVYIVSLDNPGGNAPAQVVERLVSLLQPTYPEVTGDFINQKIALQKYRLYEPVVIMRDIPWSLVVKLEENRASLPGVSITVEALRSYPLGSLAGHVLGYIHSISQEELAADPNNYDLNSLIGKSGVEKQYETYLRGTDGARRLEVDAQGRPVAELVTLNPTAGDNLTLTLDTKLQTVMENSLATNMTRLQQTTPKARVGSAVLMDVKTGEVLAMASSPTMNPGDWEGNISSSLASYYFPQGATYNPMDPGAATNRAIQAAYPPGSTFKPITGMAALGAGVNPFTDYVDCTGKYWIAPFIPCDGVHGNVDYFTGMAVSCNVYFQEMGRRAGEANIVKVAQDFGLGAKTGIDLPSESQGLLPTPAWKQQINALAVNRKYDVLRQQLGDKYSQLISQANGPAAIQLLQKQEQNDRAKLEAQYRIDYNFDTTWQAFDTFNMSIGQGAQQYTVIDLVDYIAALANGGDLIRPHVLKTVTSPDQQVIQQVQPEIIRHVAVSDQIMAETRTAMEGVTQTGGTAGFLFTNFPPSIKVAAKTGTAQTGRVGDNPLTEYHGVFVAFAPADNPTVAFAGVIEYGHHGSDSVGYVAKDVLEQYFGLVDHYAAIMAAKSPQVKNT